MKCPQCFDTDYYACDLGIDAPEDKKINLGDCMLRGLLGRWAKEAGMRFSEDSIDPVDVWGSGWVDRKKNKVPRFRFWDDPRTKREQSIPCSHPLTFAQSLCRAQ